MESENQLEDKSGDATEERDEPTETVSLLEPELQALRGHKRECAIAFILCFGACIGDFIRWILLLVFHNRMRAYYYNNVKLHGIVIGSICWDCICFMICAVIYNIHKRWIQLPSHGKWSRFLALYFAIITRVFMFIPMIWGNQTSGVILQGFVFLLQIIYYFGVWLAWLSAMSAYAVGLIYSELPQATGLATNVQNEVGCDPTDNEIEVKSVHLANPIVPMAIPTVIATPQQLRYFPMGTPIPQPQPPMAEPPPLASLGVPGVSLYDSEVDIASVTDPLTRSAFLTPPSQSR